MHTVDQIADMAENSIFYISPAGLWLRIQFCNMDEGYLQGLDEDTGDEYAISFEDITLTGDERFMMLTETPKPCYNDTSTTLLEQS